MRTFWKSITVWLCLVCVAATTYAQRPPSSVDSLIIQTKQFLYKAPDTALQLANKALYQTPLDSHEQRAVIGRLIGIAYDVKGNYQAAMGAYHSALISAQQARDSIMIANILMGKAIVYHRLSDFQRALDFYWKAHRIYRSQGRDDRLAAVKNNIGALYNSIDLHERAVIMYRDLLKLGTSLQDTQRIASSYGNMASSYVGLNQYDSAWYCIQNAIRLNKRAEDIYSLASDYQTAGVIFMHQAQYDSALYYFKHCIRPMQGVEIKAKRGAVYPSIAEVFKEQNQFDSALFYLDSAIHHLREFTLDYELLAKTYRFKGDLLAELKREGDAATFYKKALVYQDSMNMRKLESMLIRFEVENSRSSLREEIDKVKEENKDLSTKEEKAKRNFLFALIGGGFLIAFIVALYIAYTSRKRYQGILDRRNQELEADLENSERMLSVLAHDFRTPLSGLLMMVDMVQKEDATRDEIKRFGDKAKSHISRTLNGIDELLYWITREKRAFNKEDVDVFEAVNNAEEIYQLQVEDKQAHLHYHDIRGVRVFFDRSHFHIIVRNLISNSLKHIEQGGKITVTSRHMRGKTILLFQDNGTGMPPDTLASLQQRAFSKVKPGAKKPGVGLGLQLVHELVELNGAEIQIESKVGEGTTVSLTIYDDPSHL